MKETEDLHRLLQGVFDSNSLIMATLSSPHKGTEQQKATVRPVQIKGRLSYQLTQHHLQKDLHTNLSQEECLNWLMEHIVKYKQTYLHTPLVDFHILTGKKEI